MVRSSLWYHQESFRCWRYILFGTTLGGSGDPSKRNNDIDKDGETTCQGYLAHMAARTVIFIEVDNPKIGLMAFIGIDMD